MVAQIEPLEDACDQLDAVNATWRAFFLIPADASEAQEVVAALPWVSDGAPRAGTVVRIMQSEKGLMVVTGGQLSDGEGAVLLDIQAALADTGTQCFIVPSATASEQLVRRIRTTGCAPSLPDAPLPDARKWFGLAAFMLGATFYGLRVVSRSARRAAARGGISLDFTWSWQMTVVLIVGLAASLGFAAAAWVTYQRREEAVSDPIRRVAARWALLQMR